MINCSENHLKCVRSQSRDSEDESWSPTRLLDLEAADDPDQTRVKLSSRAERSSAAQYAVLSYCWGTSKFTALTQTSLDTYSTRGIVVADLPPTLRDAIVIVRELKLRYLWIDALCIIQDSPSDWLDEAIVMSKIFKYAFLNISAAAAADAHGGLFQPRDPSVLNGCAVPDLQCSFSRPWHRGTQHSPLQQRGWTFQEQILSSKIVHYAADQLLWECVEFDACEIHPRGDHGSDATEHADRMFRRRPKREVCDMRISTLEPSGTELKATFRLWSALWEDYSRRNFTYKSEKLVALSGIATEFGRFLGAENYLAGLWRQDLPHSLLWFVPEACTDSTRCSPYRAPSWSWASIDGPVDPCRSDSSQRIIQFEILDATVETRGGGGVFGPVTAGTLRLRARICPIQLTTSFSSRTDRSVRVEDGILHVIQPAQHPWFLFDSAECSRRAHQQPSYLLLLGRFRAEPGLEGLLLAGVDGQKGRFRRLGVLRPARLDGEVDDRKRERGYQMLRSGLRRGLVGHSEDGDMSLPVDEAMRYVVEIV